MNLHPWQPAVDAQLAAYKLCDHLVKTDKRSELTSGWTVDRYLLTHAVPYMWSRETTRAVLEASKSIPLDTPLNKWNLASERSWWWFEEQLPFETISQRASGGVRALAFGFLRLSDGDPVGAAPHAKEIVEQHDETFGMPVVCWLDAAPKQPSQYTMAPSQVFEWRAGQTLGSMLEECRTAHRALYGPMGKWRNRPQVGEEQFMQATEGIARFMLAGLAWLKQRVVVAPEEKLERHRRKEFARVTKREAPAVRVVSLRKAERLHSEGDGSREYHVRWIVSGHWRNQACGPRHGDRRLTYVLPYVKGPDDKPLKGQAQVVYTVDR